jgi:hypothetical protein
MIEIGGRFARKPLGHFDQFVPLPGCQLQEGFQQSQAFHGFARWSSELLVQLRQERGIFHLAPLTGNGNGNS